LSRVINPNSPGKERNRLKKGIALALREMLKDPAPTPRTRDMAAFMVLALEGITKTVDLTVTAWEKRDYWVKADRFRMEWNWAAQLGAQLRPLVLAEDWDAIAQFMMKIYPRVADVKISERHRMGQPWLAAWEELLKTTK
jgi:hypothetical protein